jgi:hypothetical protein
MSQLRAIDGWFIPARLSDNPYREDVYAGAVFSEWNPRLHVYHPFPIPEAWPMWRGTGDG